MVHGHMHQCYGCDFQHERQHTCGTKVINTCGYTQFELDETRYPAPGWQAVWLNSQTMRRELKRHEAIESSAARTPWLQAKTNTKGSGTFMMVVLGLHGSFCRFVSICNSKSPNTRLVVIDQDKPRRPSRKSQSVTVRDDFAVQMLQIEMFDGKRYSAVTTLSPIWVVPRILSAGVLASAMSRVRQPSSSTRATAFSTQAACSPMSRA